MVWELFKWAFRCCSRSLRKQTKIQRLRELARLTAELEIERLQAQGSGDAGTEVQEAVHDVIANAVVQDSPEYVQPLEPRTNSQASSTRPGTAEEPSTPRTMPAAVPLSSPGAVSTASSIDDDPTNLHDRARLCRDVLSLMTCESLKVGLRVEGLTVSGLKPDLVARLSVKLQPDPCFAVAGRQLPSDRQLRFVLWLWRHRRLQGRCQLEWADIFTRVSASNWISRWKEA